MIAKAVQEAVSVTEAATENASMDAAISVKRKRGRPAKVEGAMTQAERARRYREKHRQEWKSRRIDLSLITFDHAEKLAAAQGMTIEEVIWLALYRLGDECNVRVYDSTLARVKAAATRAGEEVELLINFALNDVSDEEWNKNADGWIRFRARRAKEAQSRKPGLHSENLL